MKSPTKPWIVFAAAISLAGGNVSLAQNAAQQATLLKLSRTHADSASSGGEATDVRLSHPGGLAFDAAGNLFIADTDDNKILEVTVDGILSVVAGTGQQGFGGDGGPATSAELDSPLGVAVDAKGNVYIADTHNNRIREVSSGVITTIAGTGKPGFSGDGGAAAAAQLDDPAAVAVDSKFNVYIADENNNRVREIVGGTISTVAGNGQQTYSGDDGLAVKAGLDSPNGVVVDSSFNIYIADTHNQRIRKVVFATGGIGTVAGTGAKGFSGDGAGISAELARPLGVAVDGSGNLYIADADNDRIRTLVSGKLSTVAGNGAEGDSGDGGLSIHASIDTPRAVASNNSKTYFSDTQNNQVQVVNAGTLNTVGGTPTNGSETLTIGTITTTAYGSGTLAAVLSDGGQAATGLVSFYDETGSSPALIGTASLSSNVASVSTGSLTAGTHSLVASYPGDAKNPAITSGIYVLVVTPLQLTATANAVDLLYGQAIPALTGTLTGVLAVDAKNVSAEFSTTATSTSNPGAYPITATLTGIAADNYTLKLASISGSVHIAQSPTSTALQLSTATPIFEAPLTLTAKVTATSGVQPVGGVNFYNGTALLNSAPIALDGSGVATLATNSLPVGGLSLTAIYSGNVDFVNSTSLAVSANNISPDFTIASTPTTQTVLPTQSASYTFTLTPVNPTFVYPVTLTTSGLPAGITATLSATTIAAGAGATPITLKLNAAASAKLEQDKRPTRSLPPTAALALLIVPLAFNRRFRRSCARLSRTGTLLVLLSTLAMLAAVSGCGGGGFFAQNPRSYTVTVTAVSGPDTHTSDVTLKVQ
jgi:sugar lactone lactonase YvrE